VLAVGAFALFVVWNQPSLSHTWAAPASLVATVAALLAALWAMLVAPSRSALLAGSTALVLSLATAVLWWQAVSGILQTT
jgi:hypothetical protein